MVNALLSVISGLLLFTGFAPIGFWPGPLFGIALLFHTLSEKYFRQRMILSFLSGLALFLPLLHWSSVYVGSNPWLVLAIGESAIFALIGVMRWKRRWESALSFAALFTLIELVRMKWPFGGFGWGRLGFTQIDSATSLYPLVGVTGVSLFVALAVFFAISWRKSLALFFVFFFFFFALNRFANVENVQRTLQVTAIQGGVDKLGLDFNNRALRVLERHVDATRNISGTDLYVWPENASDVDPLRNERANELIRTLVNRLGAPLLIGAVENGSTGPENSSLLFAQDGTLRSRYIKQDLAPFGEYIPARKMAEAISPYAKLVKDFLPGTQWIKHNISGIPFQSLICFEVLDDDHAKTGTRGSSFVVAQTNNATFGRSNEASQQLQITRARAAESGRDFVVVSTTGFTSHLDSRGKVIAIAPQFTSEALTMKIRVSSPETETPAQKLNSAMWIFGLLTAVAALRMRIRR